MARAAGVLRGLLLTHPQSSGGHRCPWKGSRRHRRSRSLWDRICARGTFCRTVHLRVLSSWWSQAASSTVLNIQIKLFVHQIVFRQKDKIATEFAVFIIYAIILWKSCNCKANLMKTVSYITVIYFPHREVDNKFILW